MKRFDALITTQKKTPALCNVQLQSPGTGGQTMQNVGLFVMT